MIGSGLGYSCVFILGALPRFTRLTYTSCRMKSSPGISSCASSPIDFSLQMIISSIFSVTRTLNFPGTYYADDAGVKAEFNITFMA